MGQVTFTEALDKAAKEILKDIFTTERFLKYYCFENMPLSEEEVIEWFKGSGVVVVTQDGRQWYNGELYLEDDLK